MAGSATPRSVLVVDDEPEIRSLLTDLLKEEGYQVRTAESAAKALPRSRRRCPTW